MQQAVRLIAMLLAIVLAGCGRSTPAKEAGASPAPSPQAAATGQAPQAGAAVQQSTRSSGRDLSADEAMGGHTLARHVGKTDDELIQRLRREPQISAASSYTDRATAESVIGAALAKGGRTFDSWRRRTGRRPNFVLHYDANRVIGHSVSRRRSNSVPCENAIVVLRWEDRRRDFYVLTSYPEANR